MAENLDRLLTQVVQKQEERIGSALKKLEPHYAKRDELNEQIEELRVRLMNEVMPQIRAIEESELIPARNDLSRAARAVGGRAMSDTV
jgi:hypothetical protein